MVAVNFDDNDDKNDQINIQMLRVLGKNLPILFVKSSYENGTKIGQFSKDLCIVSWCVLAWTDSPVMEGVL